MLRAHAREEARPRSRARPLEMHQVMCAIDGADKVTEAGPARDLRASQEMPTEDELPILLVADADRLTVWSLRHFLRGSYRVVHAPTTGEAVAHLEQGPADALVVSDNLPGTSVKRLVATALRHLPAQRVIKLVSLVEEDQEAPPTGVTTLEKPFDLGHLKEILEDLRPTSPSS